MRKQECKKGGVATATPPFDMVMRLMPTLHAGIDITGRKEAEGTFAGIGEFVRDHRVEAIFSEAEFDESPLGWLQIEDL